jgi:N-acetylneuraminic acid mutarotase
MKSLAAAAVWLAPLSIQLTLCMPVAQAQGKWVDLAPFPDPREEVMGETANGKMYVFAGLIPLWHPAGIVYEYDPASNKWTKKKQMALPSHHVAFCEHDGKIYAFGGFVYPETGPAAWVPINNTWEYDPVNDSWKALAPMPTKRGAAEAAEVNGKIYVIGGATTAPGAKENYINQTTRQNVLGTVEEYDPKTNTWRQRASMPTPRNHMGIGSVNGKIYVIGGRVGAAFIGLASDISLVEVYDPAADSWGPVGARMPTARSAVASGVYNGKIYIAGGEWQDTVVQTAFRAFEAYDPITNTWTVLPPMATPRHGVAGTVIGNRFYAVSGDVQSSGTGVAVSTPAATAFEFTK